MMNPKGTLTFDTLILELGDFGPYQIKTVLLLCIAAAFLNAWTFFDLVFMLESPDKTCLQWNANLSLLQQTFGNSTAECGYEGSILGHGPNTVTVHCQNWTFDHRYFDNTVNTQWGVCQNEALSKSIMLIFTVVGIIGHALMSVLQDIIGRKWTFLLSLTITLLGNCFSLLSPSLLVWVILRSVQGTQGTLTYQLPFIWAQEFVGPEKRTLVNFLMALFYSTATVSLGLVAWACRTWVQLGMATALPFILLYSYYFLVDESPRWLLSVGKVDQATSILEKMAKWNKKESELPLIRAQISRISSSLLQEKADPQEKQSSFQPLEFLRFPNLRLKLLLLTIIWIGNALPYTSLAFNASNISQNLYVAYIAQAAMEAPACVVNVLLSNRIGRIPPMALAMFGSSLFCLLCLPAYIGQWDEWFVVIFAALAKFGICVSYNILYQAASELYPTSLRGTGIGINNTFGDLITGAMPYILDTAITAKWIPMVILGSITLCGAICCCFLPEPMNQPMPLTAAESEKVSKVRVENIWGHLRSLVNCNVKK